MIYSGIGNWGKQVNKAAPGQIQAKLMDLT